MARQINFGGALLKRFGAYIRTDLTGLVDINGVATGIIGMIGLAEKGPANRAITINSYTELVETFGDGPLVRHGLAAYVGGANQLVCIRTGNPTPARLSAIMSAHAPPARDYSFVAREPGTLGNNITVAVEHNTGSLPGPEDDLYVIRIRYEDARGNDIRETFTLPRHFPPRLDVYWPLNPGDYFILRNRETRVVREIPSTWAHGNANETEFLRRVDELKDPSEDLIRFHGHPTSANFPIPIIASVINHGGFGQAPSQLVTLTEYDPDMQAMLTGGFVYSDTAADEFLAHGAVSLSGGNNGDDGTNFYGIVDAITGAVDYNTTYHLPGVMDSWRIALGAMEDEEVNFVQPAYLFNYQRGSNTNEWSQRIGFFNTLMPLFLAHVTSMSNIPTRKFRTSVVGLPFYRVGSTVNGTEQDFLDATIELSGLINNDRIQLWAGGFRSRAFSGRVENYGADMLASFVVGAHASRPVATSLTFAQLAGIFTDGLEFAFNQSQKDELYSRSLAFAMKRRNSTGAIEFIAAHNYTSFTGSSSRGLQLFITRRIVDYMNSFVYKNLEENFIGRKSRGAETAASISDFVSVLLDRLIRENVLVAHANLSVWADAQNKNIYYVEYDFQPITEINFIPVTNKLLYNLA